MIKKSGLIIRAIGGLFFVKIENDIIKCTARGVFRRQSKTPLVGDYVDIEMIDDENGVVFNIRERKNYIIRPPAANIDNLFIITSAKKPTPNTLILDKLFAIAEYYDIKASLIITKIDLDDVKWLNDLYQQCGYEVVNLCVKDNVGIEDLRNSLKGKINLFVGNSGVGKSTALNGIDSTLMLKTNEISEKLGRGRHTTRHIELFELESGGYIGDTPGFSTVDMASYGITNKENLQFCFKEFEPFIENCQFRGCSHTGEKGCAVIKAVSDKIIPESRHNSYCTIYDELKTIKQWELK